MAVGAVVEGVMYVVGAPALERWTLLSDAEVVTRVLAGQTALFEVLMRRHNERLYRAARAIVKDADEAEDVMQQAYISAYVHLRQFSGRSQFVTWLMRIAIHDALARVRRRGRSAALDVEDPALLKHASAASSPDPERLAFSRELGSLMESAIDGLPDGTREVFVMRQVEAFTTTEVAEILGISVDVVKTRLSRARAALRRRLAGRVDVAALNAFRFLRPRCDRLVSEVFARIA